MTLISKSWLLKAIPSCFIPILQCRSKYTSDMIKMVSIENLNYQTQLRSSFNRTWRIICAPHFLEWLQLSNSTRIGDETSGFPFQYARGTLFLQLIRWEPLLISGNSSFQGRMFISDLSNKCSTDSWFRSKLTHQNDQAICTFSLDHRTST